MHPTWTTSARRRRTAWLAASLAMLMGPAGTALATPDHVLCLAEADPGPTPTCFGEPCGTLHSTLQSALAEASSLPDIGGARPEVHLCLGVGANDDNALWTGSLSVDNRGGTYGEPLVFHLGRPMCPSPGSPGSQPLLEVATDGTVFMSGPTTRMADCASGPRPGVSVWGGGQVTVNAPMIDGWVGYAVANGVAGPSGELAVREGALLNGSGSALRSSGAAGLFEMEIAGNRTDGAAALVLLDRSGHRLVVADSSLYGNLVDLGADALVAGAPATISNSIFVANGLVGVPLVQTGAVWPDYGTTNPGSAGGIHNAVFSRNRWLAQPVSAVAPALLSTYVPAGNSTCAGVPDEPYEDRPHPFTAAPSGVAASVVRVAAQYAEIASPDEGLLFFVGRSFFLDNQGATPLRADSPGRNVSLVLAHNTFADDELDTILRVSGQDDTDVTVLRNLLIGGDGDPVLELTTDIRSVVSSANASQSPGSWTPRGGTAEFLLVGPQATFGDSAFLDPEGLRSSTPCERFAAACPDVSPTDCSTGDGSYYTCAPELAAEYFPAPSMRAEIELPWPWSTPWFTESDIETPGATGWVCRGMHGTYDRWGEAGDYDGFPDAVDCDNEDPEKVPGVPEHDGYTSPYCDASEVDCYICPDGSEPPPPDDDDDSAFDDDDSSPTGSGGDTEAIPGSCIVSGCGIGYSCSDLEGAALAVCLAPLLGMRRRRGSRA